MKNKSKRLALTGILLSLALVIGTIENYIPPIIPALPFVKVGFSNIIILTSAVCVGFFPSLCIVVLKSILVPLFVGNPIMIAYSLSASLISFLIAYGLLNTKKIGIPTTSIISAVLHNLVQLIVAYIFMSDLSVFGFLPYLLATGFLPGLVTGLISYLLIKFLPKEVIINY